VSVGSDELSGDRIVGEINDQYDENSTMTYMNDDGEVSEMYISITKEDLGSEVQMGLYESENQKLKHEDVTTALRATLSFKPELLFELQK